MWMFMLTVFLFPVDNYREIFQSIVWAKPKHIHVLLFATWVQKHSFPLYQSMIYLEVIWLLHLETKKHTTAGESVEWWASKSPLKSRWRDRYQEVTACGESQQAPKC